MKRLFKIFLCVLSFLLYLAVAVALRLFFLVFLPSRRWRAIALATQGFARSLAWIIGARIRVCGSLPAAGGIFFVSNHVGYIDGLILGALFPVIYISKIEIRRWPFIGWMSRLSGTLFIDRRRKNHIGGYIDQIAGVLRQGANVLFFPEGTSTNGEKLLAFKSAFFEAPLLASSRVVAVTLRYTALDGQALCAQNRDQMYWYGEMTFMDHFARLLSCRRIDVEALVHEPIGAAPAGTTREAARKELSERAYGIIAADLVEDIQDLSYKRNDNGQVVAQR